MSAQITKILQTHRNKILFFIILFLGLVLRIINLNWGAPYYFHPDERNIAAAVSQLHFPDQLNPHFFAYGSFTIYTIYFLGVINNIIHGQFQSSYVPFETAILISRFLSVFYALGTLVFIYLITRLLKGSALTTTFLAALSIGLVQFAHFGTVESALCFYGSVLLYILLRFLQTNKNSYYLWSCLILGILCAIKVSSFILTPIPIICVLLVLQKDFKRKKISLRKGIIKLLSASVTLALIVIGIFILTFPFSILDYQSFINSMNYESAVSLGTLQVFYTGDFSGSFPIVYQWLHIYPFILNPLTTILSISALVWSCIYAWKKRNVYIGLLILVFLFFFVPQALIFAKWTRYILPTLPFIYILLGIAATQLKKLITPNLFTLIQGAVIFISFFWVICFVKTVYLSTDTRVAAADFAHQHISSTSSILSESYDLGIIPFNQFFSHITLFDVYDLENNPIAQFQLEQMVKTNDYIILPSQRVLASRLNHPKVFPNGYSFYHDLTTGTLGYQLIYETPCDFFCRVVYLNDPVNQFEQTANVFDRPTVFIYKKVNL